MKQVTFKSKINKKRMKELKKIVANSLPILEGVNGQFEKTDDGTIWVPYKTIIKIEKVDIEEIEPCRSISKIVDKIEVLFEPNYKIFRSDLYNNYFIVFSKKTIKEIKKQYKGIEKIWITRKEKENIPVGSLVMKYNGKQHMMCVQGKTVNKEI